ncbi:hypothetical protein B0H11DRAFT_2381692, partial [Mycena galericulata]
SVRRGRPRRLRRSSCPCCQPRACPPSIQPPTSCKPKRRRERPPPMPSLLPRNLKKACPAAQSATAAEGKEGNKAIFEPGAGELGGAAGILMGLMGWRTKRASRRRRPLLMATSRRVPPLSSAPQKTLIMRRRRKARKTGSRPSSGGSTLRDLDATKSSPVESTY